MPSKKPKPTTSASAAPAQMERLHTPVVRRLSGEDARALSAEPRQADPPAPGDFLEAKKEARRAIDAWLEGKSAADLLPADRPTLATLLATTGSARTRRLRKRIRSVRSRKRSCRVGRSASGPPTRSPARCSRRSAKRARIAGNRNLALLRALFNWAVLRELVPSTPFKVGTVAAVQARSGRSPDAAPRAWRRCTTPRPRRIAAGSHRRGARDGLSTRRAALAAMATGPRARRVSAGGENKGEEDTPRSDLQRAP